MHGVTTRTLALLLVLLAAVISQQYLVTVRSVRGDAVWLAGDGALARPALQAGAGITPDS